LAKESDPCTIKSKIFQFHDDLLQYPENSVIADYTKNLFYRLGALRLLTLSDGQRVQSIQDELKAILRSLDTGNANAMRQSAHAHFDSEWSHIKVLMAPRGS
jgi:DNA-binding GntR family transcriptional regulator